MPVMTLLAAPVMLSVPPPVKVRPVPEVVVMSRPVPVAAKLIVPLLLVSVTPLPVPAPALTKVWPLKLIVPALPSTRMPVWPALIAPSVRLPEKVTVPPVRSWISTTEPPGLEMSPPIGEVDVAARAGGAAARRADQHAGAGRGLDGAGGGGEGAGDALEVDALAGRAGRAQLVEVDGERSALVDVDRLAEAGDAGLVDGERADVGAAVLDADGAVGGAVQGHAHDRVVGRQASRRCRRGRSSCCWRWRRW